jgi:hypothetical protein
MTFVGLVLSLLSYGDRTIHSVGRGLVFLGGNGWDVRNS